MIARSLPKGFATRYLAVAVILGGLTPCVYGQDAKVDWEQEVADHNQGDQLYKYINETHRPTQDELDMFMRRFPGNPQAADLERRQLAGLIADNNWDAYFPKVAKLLEQFDGRPSVQLRILGDLSLVVENKDCPEDQKARAFDLLLPRLKQQGWRVCSLANYVGQLNIPQTERYAIAQKMEQSCGVLPVMRTMMWRFLTPLTLSGSSAATVDACQSFIHHYGTDNPEGRCASKWILQQEAKEGNGNSARLVERMTAEEAAAKAVETQRIEEVGKALEKGSSEDGVVAIKSFVADVPRFERVDGWGILMPLLVKADPKVATAVLGASLDDVPEGQSSVSAEGILVGNARFDSSTVDLALKSVARCDDDRQRVVWSWDSALSTISGLQDDAAKRAEAYTMAADAAAKVGLWDQEVSYRYQAGLSGWCTDADKARIQLKLAAEHFKDQTDGANAGWLLAILEGRQGISQSGLPRPYEPELQTETAFHYPTLPPPGKSQVKITEGAATQLSACSDAEDLLAGQIGNATQGQEGAASLTDEKATGGWNPGMLPAVITIPLRHSAAIQRLIIETTDPSHFVISLLARDGRVLARQERDWSLWEYLPNANLWPPDRVILDIPPVDDVSYVRLEMMGSMGSPVVKHLSAYSCKHALTGWMLGTIIPLAPGMDSVRVDFQADEPKKEMVYDVNGEFARGFPITRWLNPWEKSGILRMMGGNVGFTFYGDNARVKLTKAGGVDWELNDSLSGKIDRVDPATNEYQLATNLPMSRQVLRLWGRALPAGKDTYGPDDCQVVSVDVTGCSRVWTALRFSQDGRNWGDWYGPLNNIKDGTIQVPPDIARQHPRFVQSGAFFDSRATRGELTATLNRLSLEATDGHGSVVGRFDPDKPTLTENLSEVAGLVKARNVVVVYSKTGSREDYQTAKALAAKAGLYLVSDDLALNSYPALPLVVGTPERNRYTRQLLASHALWQDPTYLNNRAGLVTLTKAPNGGPTELFVTGETPEAVAEAGQRLLRAIPQFTAEKAPLRVFPSNVLEVVYPWQLHPDRPQLTEIALEMGKNDKRSAQFGLTANRTLEKLEFKCSNLTGNDGSTLGADSVRIRPVSGYEWVPFFGELRLPNVLDDKPVLPVAGNTALGIWVTVSTKAGAASGDYHGTLEVVSEGGDMKIPLVVKIDNVNVPSLSTVPTFSFAEVPYWFTEKSQPWENAVRSLAEDEATQGVNYLTVSNTLRWKPAPNEVPSDQAVGECNAQAPIQWQPVQESTKVGDGQAYLMKFPGTSVPALITLGIQAEKPGKWILEAGSDQGNQWARLSESIVTNKGARVLQFRQANTSATGGAAYRVRSEAGEGATILRTKAFTNPGIQGPFLSDFSIIQRQMDLMDQVYRERGLPLPTYIMQNSSELVEISEMLYGNDDAPGGCARYYGEQLSGFLQKTGRNHRFLFKVEDEPPDIGQWTYAAIPFHEAGLQTMTCHSAGYPNIGVAIGLMNPWVPNYTHNFRIDFFKQRKEAGDKVWWYCCGAPVTRITGGPMENLPFYWLTAKWNMDGAMNYAAMHANTYSMPVPFRYEHGMDHRMVFLPDGQVLDTTRRELEGDGIRDMNLIRLIREDLVRADNRQASEMTDRLDTVLNSVVPYKFGYSQDPNAWFSARRELYSLAAEAALLR